MQRQLTAEQLALSQARKEKRKNQYNSQTILKQRPWLSLEPHNLPSDRVKVLSWNLLAQCLIKRELFPTSDSLRASQREPLIHEEIIRQDAHIVCLQEVDRLDKLLPVLETAGYFHVYAAGPHKKHGCLVAFKKELFTLASHKVIQYDNQDIPNGRKGSSFMTKNIASLVALRRNDDISQGLIVATTHLFWHPRYTYERIRQLGILIRETVAFRTGQWPCIIAGDFNFTPSDAAYSLLFGDPLLATQEQSILDSRVIHATIDPSILIDAPLFETSKASEVEDDEGSDPDRVITKARLATPKDGLMTIPEIISWFKELPSLRSAYCEGLLRANEIGLNVTTYGEKGFLPAGRQGFNEPQYTSYTFYWKSVLDYIFILDQDIDTKATVTGLAKPLTAEDLDPGIPKSGVSGSDHTALVAELSWQPTLPSCMSNDIPTNASSIRIA